jgi:hypothetical protein
MIKYLKVYIAFLVLASIILFTNIPGLASEDVVHHVIVLLDGSGSMDDTNQKLQEIKKLVTEGLSYVCFKEGTVLNRRKLLDKNKGDYLSIISFGIEENESDFSKFIRKVEFNNKKTYCYSNDFNESIFKDGLLPIKKRLVLNYNWSVIEIAIPMGINHLKNGCKKDIRVNRTFIVLITDGEYSSNDAYKDKNIDYVDSIRNKLIKNFDWTDELNWAGEQDKLRTSKVKLRIFEVKPRMENFSIQSIIKYDNSLFFNRTEEGYEADLRITFQDTEKQFSITQMKAELIDSKGNIIPNSDKTIQDLNTDKTIRFFIPNWYSEKEIDIQMKFWVHMQDDSYGVHVLYPHGTAMQGYEGYAGLNKIIPVEFEPIKTVWGWIPLSDGLYKCSASLCGSDSQAEIVKCLTTIGWVVIVFLIVILFILLYILNRIFTVQTEAGDAFHTLSE